MRKLQPVGIVNLADGMSGLGVLSDLKKMLNVYLDRLQNSVYLAHQAVVNSGLFITAEAIKNKYLSKADSSHTLMEAIKDHDEKMKSLMGKDISFRAL